MPCVDSRGVRIHYVVEGHGPPLVLHHGLTGSIRSWEMYVGELSGEYMLILVDARGHGDSGKPHDREAYGPELMTADIVAVLDDLGVERAGYWGFSMGGLIGFQLLRFCPSRFYSYIIGGMSPYRQVSDMEKESEAWRTTRLRAGAEEGPEAFISLQEKHLGRRVTDGERREMLEYDYEALYAAWLSMLEWPATGDLLSSITVPCFLYAGDKDAYHDGAREAVRHLWQGSFLSLPGLVHAEAFSRSDLVLPHVKRFLKSVTA